MATVTNSNANTTTNTPSTTTISATNQSPNNNNSNNHVSSPQSRRGQRAVTSPWTQIVRGELESAIAATPSSSAAIEQAVAAAAEEEESENGSGPNGGNVGKRSVWNKPSNGAVEIGLVMGARSWPALSESARASTKSSLDSLKGLSDGSSSLSPSVSVLQGTGNASSSSSSPKPVGNNTNTNSTPNHTVPARQRSMKRSGANTSSNGGALQPPGSQVPAGEVHLNNASPRDHQQRNSQSRSGNDHPQQQRNSFRNRNGGSHSRGDGSHHQNVGGRRDQDRGNQDWNTHRNFNGRDGHMQQQRVVPRFVRHPPPPPPPPTSTPFIPPPAVRPFGSPMGFPELSSPVYYFAPHPEPLRGVPFVAPIPPHPVFVPAPDLQLHSKIVNQIDYYFSNENLIKDIYLRQNMDDQGWVPIKLIAGFNKVSQLTNDIQLILNAVRSSTIVEVQGDKVRRHNDWMRWIIAPVQFPSVSSPQSLGKSSYDMLASGFQSMSLEEKTTSQRNARHQVDVHTEALVGKSASGDLNSQSQLSTGKGMGQVSVQGGLDHST